MLLYSLGFLTLQGLVVIAFNNGTINPDTIKEVLSVFPTYAVMKFMESMSIIFATCDPRSC